MIDLELYEPQSSSLVAPHPSGGTALLPFRAVLWASSRIKEVATVNAQKAPELLATFNRAYLEVIDVRRKLDLLLHDAQQAMSTRRSIVLLDLVPQYMKEHGISTSRSPLGSEDLRSAMLDRDEEYKQCQDRVEHLKALIKFVDGYKEGIEMAFTSVKKILGGETNWQGLNQNRNLSAGAPPPNFSPPVPAPVLQKPVPQSVPTELDAPPPPQPTTASTSSIRARFGGAKV